MRASTAWVYDHAAAPPAALLAGLFDFALIPTHGPFANF